MIYTVCQRSSEVIILLFVVCVFRFLSSIFSCIFIHFFFFLNDTATPEISPFPLHAPLPIPPAATSSVRSCPAPSPGSLSCSPGSPSARAVGLPARRRPPLDGCARNAAAGTATAPVDRV